MNIVDHVRGSINDAVEVIMFDLRTVFHKISVSVFCPLLCISIAGVNACIKLQPHEHGSLIFLCLHKITASVFPRIRSAASCGCNRLVI